MKQKCKSVKQNLYLTLFVYFKNPFQFQIDYLQTVYKFLKILAQTLDNIFHP